MPLNGENSALDSAATPQHITRREAVAAGHFVRVRFADAIRSRGAICDSNKWYYAFQHMSTEQDALLSP
jgi:hypothetical protein